MFRRSLPIASAIAAVAGVAPAAAAAQPSVTLDRSCYFATATTASPQLTDRIHVTGHGFAPGAPVTVRAAGQTLGFAPASATATGGAGGLDVTVASPHIRHGVKPLTLTVAAGATEATAPFAVTDFGAFVHPSAKPGAPGLSPRRRVAIRLLGWGVGRHLYVHFVAPGAAHAKHTVKLGRADGRCGELTVHRRHLWPFVPRKAGAWHVQFDTHRHYHSTTEPSVVHQSVITLG